ncbi:hypothetical protein [Ureibacillus sinduriensis]|uniref:hypothetical protein n=1 Tax=Ureibacillus sinduriensis TaxID=561440 RepID=UPI001595B63D|nr:hypothetical protein [Ureibacillus sinduriensis]
MNPISPQAPKYLGAKKIKLQQTFDLPCFGINGYQQSYLVVIGRLSRSQRG